jgi:hypothetical protein
MTGLNFGRFGRIVTVSILVIGLAGCSATRATEYLHMSGHDRAAGDEAAMGPAQQPDGQRNGLWRTLTEGEHCLTYEDFMVLVNGEGAPRWAACDETHYAQVYEGAVLDAGTEFGPDYPGEDMAATLAQFECEATFEDWAGVPYNETSLDMIYLVYDADHWSRRSLPPACFAVHPYAVFTSDVAGKGADFPLRNENGEPDAPIEVASGKLRAGDCVRGTSGYGYETIVPCDLPHSEQVSAVFDLPAGDYPGEDDIDEITTDACIDHFATYVGEDYEYSAYYTYSYWPTEESWIVGHREVQCRVYDLSGDIEGSLAGTGEGRAESATTNAAGATSRSTAKSFLM